MEWPQGDAVNVILIAAGHNPRLLIAWLSLLLCAIRARIALPSVLMVIAVAENRTRSYQ